MEIKEQADCSQGIPDNTHTGRYIIVTVPGHGAEIGDLLHDDGSGEGKMKIVKKHSGTVKEYF